MINKHVLVICQKDTIWCIHLLGNTILISSIPNSFLSINQ